MKRKTNTKPRENIEEPTPEQRARGEFVLQDITDRGAKGTIAIGKAYRRTPAFEVLGRQGVFSDAELKALRHYRHHADIADRSPLRDSLRRWMPSAGGDGPSVTLLNAVRVRDDLERAAGSLAPILRAVVVDDMSLSDWAIRQAGGVEKCRDRGRRGRVCVIEPRDVALRLARLDMQMVAKRIQAELDA